MENLKNMEKKCKLVAGGMLISAILLIVVFFFMYFNTPIAETSLPTSVEQSTPTQEELPESRDLKYILSNLEVRPWNNSNQMLGESYTPIAQRVKDKLYFWEDNILKCYNSATEKLTQFAAIVAEDAGDSYFKWLISGDEKKVAWTERIDFHRDIDDATFFEITLSVADLDGKNKFTLVLEGADREVVELANFYHSEELYFGTQYGEAGGWFVDHFLLDLYRLNTSTGKKELLLGREFDQGVGCYITALSNKAEYVAYFHGLTLVVRELASGKEIKIPIPASYDPVYFGVASFSSDNKKLTFPLASYIGSPDEYEIYKYVMVNLETKTVKIYEPKMEADNEITIEDVPEKYNNPEMLGKKVTGSGSETLEYLLKGIDNPLNRNNQMIEYYDDTPLVSYQLVDDQFFFCEENILKCYNLATKELSQFESVVFVEKWSLWLVSGDGQKVAWTEQISESEYAIYVADFDGMNKLMIIEEGFDYNLLLENFDNSEELYYGERNTSYHNDNLQNLYKLDFSTGESELILEKKFEQSNDKEYIIAVSNNAEYVAYFQGLTLIIRELASNQETKISIPTSYQEPSFGDSSFSPDNKKLVFRLAVSSEETNKMLYEYVVADLEAKTAKIYQVPEGLAGIGDIEWLTNNILELSWGKNKVQVEL